MLGALNHLRQRRQGRHDSHVRCDPPGADKTVPLLLHGSSSNDIETDTGKATAPSASYVALQQQPHAPLPQWQTWLQRAMTFVVCLLSFMEGIAIYKRYKQCKICEKMQSLGANYVASDINAITACDHKLSYPPNSTIATKHHRPEELALQWIIAFDKGIPRNGTTIHAMRFRWRQRYALLTLWFQQTPLDEWIGLDEWTNTRGWLTEAHECDWYGVVCGDWDFGGHVGSQRFVRFLDLKKNNIHGTFSPDLALLSNLQGFNLERNPIAGTLPSSIGKWKYIYNVYLSETQINGTLPSSIGNWKTLQQFIAWGNNLSGSLPSEIGQWTDLERLLIANNRLTGPLPTSIGNWTHLIFMDVRNNSLSGTLPRSMQHMTWLREVDLSLNNFHGNISKHYDYWKSKLELLYLRGNSFTGALPQSFRAVW